MQCIIFNILFDILPVHRVLTGRLFYFNFLFVHAAVRLARWFLCGMRRARRRTLVEYYSPGARTELDRLVSRNGSILLYTTHWQESSFVEHQRLPQSWDLPNPGTAENNCAT